METILFGGNNCKITIKDYLYNQVRAIAVQIEHGLRANKAEEQIKKEMVELFTVEKFSVNISGTEMTDIGANHYESRMKEGRQRKVLIKHYYYSVPFNGDSSIIKFRPTTFHGHNCKVDIIGHQNPKTIRAYFESEENFQQQFDHNKSQSIGDLTLNVKEANIEIENWNKVIAAEVDRVFPIVKSEYDKTIDFNRRNNIKN